MIKHFLPLTLLLLTMPTHANDSNAAIGLGGLELIKNEVISMDSEDLFISQKQIRVKYKYTNTSKKDVSLLISFPLPAIPDGIDGYLGDQSYPDWQTDVQFKTLVDGKAVKLGYTETYEVNGKNVEARIKQLKWPLKFWNDSTFDDKIEKMNASERIAFVKEGLLKKSKDGDYYYPNWKMVAQVTRTQTFPAGKSVTVEHSYAPILGGSVGGTLERQYRTQKDMGFAEYAKEYCIDKSFLSGFDRIRYAKPRKGASEDERQGRMYGDVWISYILKSGANWRGPIKDFRLVVDKGTAENLVSFCMDGVKKIAPTQFEVRKTNFEPTKDLDILIVGWAPLE
jgi:Domain of unknown function (DUF4424)